LASLISADWGFVGLRRRPATDPVNALLSFGYSLVTAEIVSAIAGAGLHDSIGFLHSSRNDRPNLALDLVEEFRPLIVDSLVLSLLNNRRVTPKDFETLPDSEIRLSSTGRRRFFNEYERRVGTRFRHPETRRTMSYRESFETQARHLNQLLTDNITTPYQPVRWT